METTANPSLSIPPAELLALIQSADAPLVLDVRRDAVFDAAPDMLRGAVRCAPQDVAAFAATQPKRPVVVYCVYGHKVSEEAAQTLVQAGWPARRLAGGIAGGQDGVDDPGAIATWRATQLPRVVKAASKDAA
jgi:rhodanese-related sulfurtransferase